MHGVEITSGGTAVPAWQWIRGLYVDLVGRRPGPRELDRFAAAARRGAAHRDIARDLLASDAYCRAQIAALYRTLLDRDGDAADLAAWTDRLRSGTTLQDIIAGFCDSFEYKSNHPVDAPFIESLYQRLLLRASDPDGKAGHVAALQHRASTLSVIRSFLCSAEYCTQRVTEVHARLLGREPTRGELAEHVVALMHGAPLQHLVLEIVTSAEYIARAAKLRPDAVLDTPHAIQRSAAEPPHSDPDQDALALVDTGDVKDALQLLMQRHGAAVYRYCRVALDDEALADDVHQQVFLEALRDLPRFERRSTARTWLLGIARHRVLDAARSRQRAGARHDAAAAEPVVAGRSAGESLDDARLQAALIACLGELDVPVRTAILLRYQQGLTFEEMAEICGEKPGTLQARVARALRRLRARIESRTSSSL
jgi:RNA polymerase sigma factor (sigma-70 family)